MNYWDHRDRSTKPENTFFHLWKRISRRERESKNVWVKKENPKAQKCTISGGQSHWYIHSTVVTNYKTSNGHVEKNEILAKHDKILKSTCNKISHCLRKLSRDTKYSLRFTCFLVIQKTSIKTLQSITLTMFVWINY